MQAWVVSTNSFENFSKKCNLHIICGSVMDIIYGYCEMWRQVSNINDMRSVGKIQRKLVVEKFYTDDQRKSTCSVLLYLQLTLEQQTRDYRRVGHVIVTIIIYYQYLVLGLVTKYFEVSSNCASLLNLRISSSFVIEPARII